VTLDTAIERLYELNVGTTQGERTRPRVLFPAPSPETFRCNLPRIPHAIPRHRPIIREGADDDTRGACAPRKNHHWAMDRNLIAPCPDHHWRVSKILDPRRSNGEKELSALSGQVLLLPQDEAFHPDATGLQWRCERLSA
jgi:hypothetical protein